MKKVLLVIVSLIVVFCFASCAKASEAKTAEAKTPVVKTEYSVGDIGPAGGYVFYDKGEYSDGWRYLEAAPADLKVIGGVPTVDSSISGFDRVDGRICFGFYRESATGSNLFVNGTTRYDPTNCTLTDIGTGKNNTLLLVEAMGDKAWSLLKGDEVTQFYPAKLCYDLVYTVDGITYDDWFLPSQDELDLMYNNVKAKGLGGFVFDSLYWSSSEYDPELMWRQYFDNGYQLYGRRDIISKVRPVRAF